MQPCVQGASLIPRPHPRADLLVQQPELSVYELQRNENVLRNEQKLRELGILNFAAKSTTPETRTYKPRAVARANAPDQDLCQLRRSSRRLKTQAEAPWDKDDLHDDYRSDDVAKDDLGEDEGGGKTRQVRRALTNDERKRKALLADAGFLALPDKAGNGWGGKRFRSNAPQPMTAKEALAAAEAESLILERMPTAGKYRGVSREKHKKVCQYRAKVHIAKHTTVNLGCYETAEEAALAFARHMAKAEQAAAAAEAPPVDA